MDNYIVTAIDSKAWNLMIIAFLGSLYDQAKWTGRVVVIDNGMSEEQIRKLDGLNIKVIPRANRYNTAVLDRFHTIYQFQKTCNGIFAHWDADCWFTRSPQGLFDSYKGGITCTVDCVRQGFVAGSIGRKASSAFANGILDKNEKQYKKVLQAGWLMGDNTAWEQYEGFQQYLLDSGDIQDSFGGETMVLNLFGHYFPLDTNVVDISFNCLPDWGPKPKDGKLFVGDLEVGAIHRTSPYRHGPDWAFETHYPDIFKKWHEKLWTISREVIEVKGVKFEARPGTNWDNAILNMALNNYDYNIENPGKYAILDIGAHIGGYTRRIALKYPDVIIHAYEPDQENFVYLQKNCADLPNVKVYNSAILNSSHNYIVHNPDPSNSGMPRIQISPMGKDKATSINDAVERIPSDRDIHIKTDCEGSEWNIILGITPVNMQRIKYIQGCPHWDLIEKYCNLTEPKTDNTKLKLMQDILPGFNITIDGWKFVARRK